MNCAARACLAMLLFFAAITHASLVPAQDARACAEAFETSQLTERDGKLLSARRLAAECARDSCPAVIRAECIKRHQTLAAAIPSLVIVAREASGRDVVDAQLIIDGFPVNERLDGTAVEVDPGAHVVRVEAANRKPVEQIVLVAQGEQQRMIVFKFESDEPPVPPADASKQPGSEPALTAPPPPVGAPVAATAALPPPVEPEPEEGVSPLIWGGFGLGGVGLIVGGVTAGLAFSGASTCEQQGCTREQLDSELTVAHVSTVSFVVAGAGVTVGLIGLFTAGSSDDAADVALVATPAFSGIVGAW